MSDWKSRATQVDSTNDWKSRAAPLDSVAQGPGILQTIADQASQGATFGFGDEINGVGEAIGRAAGFNNAGTDLIGMSRNQDGATLDLDKLKAAYVSARDKTRNQLDAEQSTHPVISGASQVGGMFLNPIAGEMGVAKLAGLGGLQGLGDSKADLTEGDYTGALKDTAIGTAIGGATAVAAPYVNQGLKAVGGKVAGMAPEVAEYLMNKFNKGISKVGAFTTGADSDALLRNIERPSEMVAAKGDGFAYDVGKKAVQETEDLGTKLGKNVGDAKLEYLKDSGHEDVAGLGDHLADQVDDFLGYHAPSQKGFSALNEKQIDNLENISSSLRGGQMTGEDLVKVRDYLDNVEKLASQYEKEGSPYTNFLKQLRGQADHALDQMAPAVDSANTAFAQFKSDTGLLRSSTNQGQSESMINNLYGANKGAQQDAASRLFSPDTLEQAKDIAANKAVSNANNPGGQNYFRHGALPVMTMGASELATRPDLVAKSFRGLGTVEDKIGYALKNAPDMLGPFAKILSDAATRGPEAMTATHFLLQQTSEDYRNKISKMSQQ
jgi:hypothetical protein